MLGRKTPIVSEAERKKQEFIKYVEDIAAYQRNQLADRIVTIQNHSERSWPYFIGSIGGTVAATFALMHLWGPRHMANHRVYIIRPLAPAVSIGATIYGMLYSLRLAMMKLRFWTLVEDYEYELKKANAHHVEAGVNHLAWLQFVLEQVKTDRTPRLDIDAIRRGTILLAPAASAKQLSS